MKTDEEFTMIDVSEKKFEKLSPAGGEAKAPFHTVCERLWPYALLAVFTLALLLLPLDGGEFFGSEGDWYSQHVAAAEALRQTMLEQGTVFPQHINIGGGANAYDLAYYGLLRPDVLISCMLADVPMKDIIAAYACIGVIASAELCFVWLRRKGLSLRYSAAGAVMMAAAACFFHAHSQIIFVNYMPFLITALIGTDVFIEKRKSMLLMISVFLICVHSFFYAPTCIIVCMMYYFHRLGDIGGRFAAGARQTYEIGSGKLKLTLQAAAAVAAAVGTAAVLLLPTAVNIFSTEKVGGSFSGGASGVLNLSLDGLLYSPYGCGLTMLALYGLLLALWDRRKRLISAAVLTCQLFPAVSLALSGFLYSRGKILIPFLPLVIWICAETFEEAYEGKRKLRLIPALLCVIPSFFSEQKLLMIAESALILLWALSRAVLERFEKNGSRKSKRKKIIHDWAVSVFLTAAVYVSLGVNILNGEYISADDKRQNRFEPSEISEIVTDNRYRFDYISDGYVNSNMLPAGDINKTSMYSSVSNSLYSVFFYDTMKNPITARNRVALTANENIFFNYFMGIRYVLAESEDIPFGYEKIAEKDGYAIAENENVLPICYGVYGARDKEKGYEKLDFPYNAAALTGSVIEETDAEWTDGGIKLSERAENEAVIISFDIDRRDGKEVVMTVEGIKNKLSGKDAAYPNGNHSFTYVLTSEKPLENLEVEATEGDYSVENLKAYKASLPLIEAVMPVFYSELEAGQVFSGSINMREDGYFITSFPYKKGYSVKADGEEIELEPVNTAFLGFPLEKGEHDIEITYTAPGFWAGLAISLASLAAAALMVRGERKRR